VSRTNDNNPFYTNHSSGSVEGTEYPEYMNSDFFSESREQQKRMNETLDKMYDSMRNEQSKVNLNLNYQLNQKIEFRLWSDQLK